MSKNLLFSVIIPVYNMQPYLERCLDSVVNQSYKNLEIIIVNDGSADGSLDIIKRYAQSDERIIVIDKLNEGIGGAYMDALEIVKGDYISFVDGDDFIELNMYEILAQHISDKNADIVQFGYQKIDHENKILSKVNFGEGYFEGNKDVLKYKYEKILHPSIGLKVVRKDLFENIKLLRQNIGIDILITLQTFLKAKSLYVIKDSFYTIFVRENSVSRSKYNDTIIQQLLSMRNLIYTMITSSKNKQIMVYNLPTLINESIVICNYYYKNGDKLHFNTFLAEYRTHYVSLRQELSLCKTEIILKASLFYYLPVIYLRIMGSRIKI